MIGGMTVLVVGAVNTDLVIDPAHRPARRDRHRDRSSAPARWQGRQPGRGRRPPRRPCRSPPRRADFDPASLPGVDLSAVLVRAHRPGSPSSARSDRRERHHRRPRRQRSLAPPDVGPPPGRPASCWPASRCRCRRCSRRPGRRVGRLDRAANPAPAHALPASLLADVDVLVPNEHELAALGDPDDLLTAGVGAVVVTLGAAGCRIHRPAGTASVPAYPVRPWTRRAPGTRSAPPWRGPWTPAARWTRRCGSPASRAPSPPGAVGARAALPTAADLAAAWPSPP